MTNVTNVGLSQPVATQQSQAVVPPNVIAAQNENAVSGKQQAADPSTPISPRVTVDPFAGLITEFLSATGQVESQVPSAAVVAYLRAGLTPEGTPKPTPDQTEHTEHKNAVVA